MTERRARSKQELVGEREWIDGDRLCHRNPDNTVTHTYIRRCPECGWYFKSSVPPHVVGLKCGECAGT